MEIVAAHCIVFALAQSDSCVALSRETNHRMCLSNDLLVECNFSSLKCRTTRIECMRRGKPDADFSLFESESLKWPGFVELYDTNGKVPTYSAQDSIYKVFDLKNYSMLFPISDKKVQGIKFNEKPLVKQENENLQILDVRNSELTEEHSRPVI
ncbi:hypothetical protein U1Q18_019650 [Sarracenia purpurea var. burkii]